MISTVLWNRFAGVAHELSVLQKFRARHRPRLLADILLFRAMRFVQLPRAGSARTVEMRDGTRLTYRLDRGDIQAIREIWLDEIYMPWPDAASARQLVDLGANIGFASLYLARRLNDPVIIAVEPDPDNLAILRHNFAQNGVRAFIIAAAVGSADGYARFRRERASNLGRLDPAGDSIVKVVSMLSVMTHLPDTGGPTMLKLDIEGGEEQVFQDDVSWLARFTCLLGELHPGYADLARITKLIEASGMRYRRGRGHGQPAGCWNR